MKVGSLVTRCRQHTNNDFVFWRPEWGEIVTVRQIVKNPDNNRMLLRFHEGVMGFTPCGFEIGAYMGTFRELQPPMDLSELLEETTLLTQ